MLRSHLGYCLLGLLLLFVASRGMRLPRESNSIWQHGKDASYEILRELEKLDIKEPEASFDTTVQFPQPIECSDSCDPDSLATTNKMQCLAKISKGLHDYHNLLIMFSNSNLTTELQKALNSLLQLPLLKVGSNDKRSSPVIRPSNPDWQTGLLQNLTLWRLQSFGVVVARVFTHCASLS